MAQSEEFLKHKGKINEIREKAEARNPEAYAKGRSKGGKVAAQRMTMANTLRRVLDEMVEVEIKKGEKVMMTRQDAIMTGMSVQAIKGNVRAATFIRDTIGEKPADKIEMTTLLTPDEIEKNTEKIMKLVNA